MKQKIILVIISILIFTSIPFTVNANTNVDYESMSEYDGFAKAVYESYVTNTTYVAGKYTNNLQYVNETISKVKANANLLWEGFKNEDCGEGCNWGVEFIKSLLAGGVTAIDLIKDFFDKEKHNYDYASEEWFLQYLRWDSVRDVIPNSGYRFIVKDYNGEEQIVYANERFGASSRNEFALLRSTSREIPVKPNVLYADTWALSINNQPYSFLAFLGTLQKLGVSLYIQDAYALLPVQSLPNDNYTNINNYIQYNRSLINSNYKPPIKSKLVCANMTIDLQINGFQLLADGQVLEVNKQTGATTYNNENCIVHFNSVLPVITDDNRVVTKNDDGTLTDVETNEKLDEQGRIIEEINGNPDNCDGILCFMSSVVKAVSSIPLKIIDGILGGISDLLKFLLVPSSDSFNGFIDELNTTMSEKFNLTVFTNVFNEMTPNQNARTRSTTSSNTFDGVMVDGLMGTGEVKIIDGDTINAMLPTLHSWIKGFFYVLLAFFNINHMYKLIRGTTIFESMRGKGE